jgi:hypothetical protein
VYRSWSTFAARPALEAERKRSHAAAVDAARAREAAAAEAKTKAADEKREMADLHRYLKAEDDKELKERFRWQSALADTQPLPFRGHRLPSDGPCDDAAVPTDERPKVDVSGFRSPLEFFRLFWSDDIETMLVDATNANGVRRRDAHGGWSAVTAETLRAVLSVQIEMAILKVRVRPHSQPPAIPAHRSSHTH